MYALIFFFNIVLLISILNYLRDQIKVVLNIDDHRGSEGVKQSTVYR